jgi:Ca2+-binding EF-hand superfamily protein
VRGAFFLLDRDKDGFLTGSELPDVTAEAIRAADGDSDGKLTAMEYINQRFKEFEAADRNRDGVLTHVEVEAYDEFGRVR